MAGFSFLPSFKSAPEKSPPEEQVVVKDQSAAQVNPYIQEEGWWRRYNDPLLNKLVEQLLSQNLELTAAGERLLQAQERITAARAGFFPSLSADANASRRAIPLDGGVTSTGGSSLVSGQGGSGQIITNDYDLGVSAAWQIDLFGKIRNAQDAAEASYLSTRAERQALAQNLIIQLLRQRVVIANLSAQIRLTEETINSRAHTMETLQRRYELGSESVTALDIRLAKETLAAAKAELPQLIIDREDAVFTLDVLLGEMPGTTPDIKQTAFPLLPPPGRLDIPPPVALLDRRPDIQASRYRLEAAKENVGVAVADLFPSLSISGGYGFEASVPSSLFTSEQIAWNLLGNVMAPLFEGGRLRANIRQEEAKMRELAADYAQTILTAVQDVESALVREDKLHGRLAMLKETEGHAEEALTLANGRYEKGLIDLTQVLDIERRLFSVKQQVLGVQRALWQARLDLILALGGDWYSGETINAGLRRENDKEGHQDGRA